jgi:hypothetical protein
MVGTHHTVYSLFHHYNFRCEHNREANLNINTEDDVFHDFIWPGNEKGINFTSHIRQWACHMWHVKFMTGAWIMMNTKMCAWTSTELYKVNSGYKTVTLFFHVHSITCISTWKEYSFIWNKRLEGIFVDCRVLWTKWFVNLRWKVKQKHVLVIFKCFHMLLTHLMLHHSCHFLACMILSCPFGNNEKSFQGMWCKISVAKHSQYPCSRNFWTHI